ncbi:M3 family oligoendopeptidase [Tengunoibacter tsumagoiensis]|uniref:Oligoendopeptidase F n=1 Tax=Tengunoibacter tsumagoiensis TaxID=2014871 RepID=A0A401ZU28_9CHLR|nr:M3 family oligoendopeptidase [Tengunoibacter tsumagoiensis]GCE10428.1 oligoendopeptidase F [Tengunoibacter tsumagoiensis]
MTKTSALPHWNMSVVYPDLSSQEFAQGMKDLTGQVGALASLFDDAQVGKLASAPGVPADYTRLVPTFEKVLESYNNVLEQARTIFAYVSCLVSTDSYNDLAQASMSELKPVQVLLAQLGTRFTAWIGSLDEEELLRHSALVQAHAYSLRKTKEQSSHLMSPVEEDLAAELNVSAGSAWSKLHTNLTSQLLVTLSVQNEMRSLPMSAIRNFASDPDREIRKLAYDAELEGWRQIALPLAAAYNSIKGEVNTISQRRKWASPLEASLFANSIDQGILNAMLNAARAAFPDFRRYLRAKAHTLQLPQLAWYDLFAPLGTQQRAWSFEEAETFIITQFSTYSSRLADFAQRAFREQWIDAEPRPGKRDGAYCTSLRGEESRIFANFKSTFGEVSTLAHELGHGYHNLNLASRTSLQRSLPKTLAETASIFCETIIQQAALRNASREEQITILEASLQGSCQVVVDICSRFLFEQRSFERRQRRELSIEELNTLMLEAQSETYGDGLDQSYLHPYMWAVKGHYYSTGLSFYNYPYMFGLLFGLGLYARYQQDPEYFKQSYDDLLSSTGLADAATLAARFEIDLYSEAFWTASLDIIRQDINLFCELTQ